MSQPTTQSPSKPTFCSWKYLHQSPAAVEQRTLAEVLFVRINLCLCPAGTSETGKFAPAVPTSAASKPKASSSAANSPEINGLAMNVKLATQIVCQ
jgi:hypothetical protein